MYIPPQFAEPRLEELHHIVREHALGVLITNSSAGLDANHLPFILETDQGGYGVLTAHVARANPLWREVQDGQEVLVVFRGVEAYISPNWYPSKHETHRQVPTWNYQAVHAYGTLTVHDDERFVRSVVAKLTRKHEASEPKPWKMGDSAPDFINDMLRNIVGIKITLTSLVGKFKLSQNREERDRLGAADALDAKGHNTIARAMRELK